MGISAYIVSGLLEAGKTTYILSCLEKTGFEKPMIEKSFSEGPASGEEAPSEKDPVKAPGKTLVAALEEGEVAYPEEKGLEVIFPSSGEELKDLVEGRVRKGGLERVVIETNAMQGELKLPSCLTVVSRVTLIDASSLGVQYRNLQSVFDMLVRNSDIVIFNRIPSPKLLSAYGDGFRVMNARARFLRESVSQEGISYEEAFTSHLPFDRDQDPLRLPEEAYIPWILDLRENPWAYEGKEVEVTLQADPRFPAPKGCILAGRLVMTCCILDVQFLSLPCLLEGQKKPERRTFVRLRARVQRAEDLPEKVVLKALQMEEVPPPREMILMGGAALLPQE